ncbi:MAG: nucleotidyltransferase domain-containing protein [Candidatus Hodarchaeaceae archaeon]|nr:nucleotidyltransferase domain-containing protein [Candidatus Hodarchaeaceae archaeon]
MTTAPFLEEFIRRAHGKYPQLRILPFGSSMRGEWKPAESDLDILVFSSQSIPGEVRADLYNTLLRSGQSMV